MNADLEETLGELGDAHRQLVVRMRDAFAEVAELPARRMPFWTPRRGVLAAALGLALLGFGTFLLREPAAHPSPVCARTAYVIAYASDAQATATLVRTQHVDGSWDNDFLTRQNAAALRGVATPAARVAYRRAVRYLRAKGLAPLTDQELRARSDLAARRLRG